MRKPLQRVTRTTISAPGWIVSAPLLLGSWWAFIPAAATLLGLVIRTALEDRTLREELDGYAAYAQKVRFRLVPGIW